MRRTPLLLLALLPTTAYAQPIETVPPGEDHIVVLEQGEPAPYAGQLFDNSTSLRWANWLRQYKMRLRLDVEKEQQLCAVKMAADQKLLLIEQEKYNRVVLSYEVRVRDLENEKNNPPWYSTAWFGVATGVVATSAVVSLTLWAHSN